MYPHALILVALSATIEQNQITVDEGGYENFYAMSEIVKGQL